VDCRREVATPFRYGQEAVQTLRSGDPNLAKFCYNVALTLYTVYLLNKDVTYLGAAIELLQAASADRAAPTSVRASAAESWGRWAEREAVGNPAFVYPAADGYAAVVALLPVLAWTGLRRGSRERSLAQHSAMPGLAAAFALESGDPQRAIGVLELGRSVIWGQLLDSRTDLDELQIAEPELARRLDVVRTQLDPPSPGVS